MADPSSVMNILLELIILAKQIVTQLEENQTTVIIEESSTKLPQLLYLRTLLNDCVSQLKNMRTDELDNSGPLNLSQKETTTEADIKQDPDNPPLVVESDKASDVDVQIRESLDSTASTDSDATDEYDPLTNQDSGDNDESDKFKTNESQILTTEKKVVQQKKALNPMKKKVKVYHCFQCEKTSKRPKSLVKHEMMHLTSTEGRISCRQCDAIFTDKSEYVTHAMDHLFDDNKCRVCDMSFDTKRELGSHTRKEHMAAFQKTPCEICGKLLCK